MHSTQVEVVSPSSANEAGLGVGTSAEVQYEETDDGHALVPTPHRIARFPPPESGWYFPGEQEAHVLAPDAGE